MSVHLGSYSTSGTRIHVGFQFTTVEGTGGLVAPSSGFEADDLRIYRAAANGAFSATQRSSANGITMTSPFDSVVGLHDVDIDLTDNTDAGFYTAGYRYAVIILPDETVDGQTVGSVLAYFEIGPPPVNVTQLGGVDQSLTDLKDFADTGYDPATHKVQGVVLVDTLTTYTSNTVQTGDAYAVVNSATFGNAKLVRSTTPANTLSVDANHAVTAGTVSDKTAYSISGTKTTLDALNDLSAAGIRTAVGLATNNLDTQLAAIAGYIDTEVASILADAVTLLARITGSVALNSDMQTALSNLTTLLSRITAAVALASDVPTTAQIADKLLGRNIGGGSDGTRTVSECFQLLRNRWTRTASTLTVYAQDDATVSWTSVLTTNDLSPVSESNP